MRPCWLCAQPNTPETAGYGPVHQALYLCSSCGIELDYFVPLVRPLAGEHFLWKRPADISVKAVIHAAELWEKHILQGESDATDA